MLNSHSGRAMRAGLFYFALVFAAGTLMGFVRVPFLVPRLGERTAELLEAPVMLVVIFFASRFIVRRFGLDSLPRIALAAGLCALALLIAAELSLAAALTGSSVGAYLTGRDPISGSVYLGSLILYAALPWLHARRSRKA